MAINDRIELKLVIDGKESLITLSDIKKEVIKVKQEAGSVTSGGGLDKQLNDTAGAMENTAAAAEKLKDSTQEAKQAQDQLSSANQKAKETAIPAAGSMAALEQEIKQVANAMKQAVIGTDEFKAKQAELIALQTRLHNATRTATETTVAGATRMNMAIGGLGYAIGDANMFLYDFRIGMMAIGNNIPIIIEHFVAAKAAATGMGSSVKDVLIASLKGPGGLLLAINAVILAMQILPKIFGEQTEAIKDQAEEIKKLRDEYQKLTREQLKQKITQQKDVVSAEENRLKDSRWIFGPAMSQYSTGVIFSEEEYNKAIQRYGKNAISVIEKGSKVELNNAKEKLSVMEQELFMLGDKESIQNRLTQLQQKQNDLNEQNWRSLVPQAKDRQEATKIIQDAIKKEEKSLEMWKDKAGGGDKLNILIKDYEAEQDHQIRLMELYNFSTVSILQKQGQHLQERLNLYRIYGNSVLDIERQIKENTIMIEKAKQRELENARDKAKKDQEDEDRINKSIDDAFNSGDNMKVETISMEDLSRAKIALIENEYDQKRAYNDLELQLIEDKYNAIAGGETMITMAREHHAKERVKIDQDEASMRIQVITDFIIAAGRLFGEQTAAYKLLAIAQATMDTYAAATVALKAYPPPWNMIAMGTVIATGLANVARIQETKIPGYARGGVVVGENGPEIITPMQDYASGWGQIIVATTKAVERSLRYGNNDSRVQQHEFRIKGRDLVTTAKRDEEGMLKKRW